VGHYPRAFGLGTGSQSLSSPPRTLVKSPRRRDEELPTSHLGRAITVKGVLDTDGEIYIHGNVQGQINADKLVLGSGGSVEGDIVAREVRIGGRLRGRVFAFTVALDSSADITGRIFHHIVTVEKGAKIDGRMPWRPLNFFESFEQPPETQT
jgi:cytoskeletal protein CcmA (bactofilin family)